MEHRDEGGARSRAIVSFIECPSLLNLTGSRDSVIAAGSTSASVKYARSESNESDPREAMAWSSLLWESSTALRRPSLLERVWLLACG